MTSLRHTIFLWYFAIFQNLHEIFLDTLTRLYAHGKDEHTLNQYMNGNQLIDRKKSKRSNTTKQFDAVIPSLEIYKSKV